MSAYLELLFQLLPQRAQFLHALAEVNVTVELDEGLDEVGHAPLRLDLVAAADAQAQQLGVTHTRTGIITQKVCRRFSLISGNRDPPHTSQEPWRELSVGWWMLLGRGI